MSHDKVSKRSNFLLIRTGSNPARVYMGNFKRENMALQRCGQADSECRLCVLRQWTQNTISNMSRHFLCGWAKLENRDDRWFVFKLKIPNWVNLGGSCNWKGWYFLFPFGLFYGHWKYFMDIWYILWSFGIFCGHLVYFVVIWYNFPRFGMLY
jgi:hypothetical protein